MGRVVEKKRKKKGRPSLLDLQKRSLRLQQQQKKKKNPNPNLSTNPYARFPRPIAGRLPTRRNSIPEPETRSPEEDGNVTAAAASADDDDDEDQTTERRKEKKLKHVLHPPHPNANSSDSVSSESESDVAEPKTRKIDEVEKLSTSKKSCRIATEITQEEKSDLGPTTYLPDKKLLEFILDRLQKKDTYGVFSEPVDLGELPDYHDIIEHPMDFGTVRKRLSIGAYQNLEQFEKDVLLISSNAMSYNAPDTVYFRQARSIQELAKKSFANLRQESDDNEPEPKIVRRGRPPGTSKNKEKMLHIGSDCCLEASLASALDGNLSFSSNCDLMEEGLGLHKQREDVSARCNELNAERGEDYLGSTCKGSTKKCRKVSCMDEKRRDTYSEFQASSSMPRLPLLASIDGGGKILVPVGLHVEYSYARSLARFAANLGPVGRKIAAQRIEKALPPGTNFDHRWVVESDAPTTPNAHLPPFPDPSHHRSPRPTNFSSEPTGDECSKRQEDRPSQNLVEQPSCRTSSPSSASVPDRIQLHRDRMMPISVDDFKATLGNPLNSCGQYSFRLPQQQFNSSMPCSPSSRWGEGCQPSS
ncbi:hypothetical protein HPP92_025530 [Vanilla planifolia]|uniref:Bromo domain-containing protein n=1 Tax=Vanilla planifolia TaxID=51239 RepID=A0A835PIM2_VANPL|nr:hypothetical protein HPP92_025530 [Vanilla planifolia]